VQRGQVLSLAPNLFDTLAHFDPYAAVGDACARAATVLAKIASDLRFLSSGPSGGIGEITLPALQAGSSIMPGKVNPVIPELVLQLGFRIRGAAETVRLATAAGELELNVMEPVILDALATALSDLTPAPTSQTSASLACPGTTRRLPREWQPPCMSTSNTPEPTATTPPAVQQKATAARLTPTGAARASASKPVTCGYA